MIDPHVLEYIYKIEDERDWWHKMATIQSIVIIIQFILFRLIEKYRSLTTQTQENGDTK